MGSVNAIGNGLGGGDYYGAACQEMVGTWALDLISIEDYEPDGFTKTKIVFEE